MRRLGDEHAVAGCWGELLDLVFEHLQGEHLAGRVRHDKVHGPSDLACRDAVGDLRPARDDDGRVFDSLGDVEDHWIFVLIPILYSSKSCPISGNTACIVFLASSSGAEGM